MLLDKISADVLATVTDITVSGGFRRYEGDFAQQLSEALSVQSGNPHCLLASSGTAALECGLRAIGVADAEVLLSGYDYPGNFWAIERAGARPVLTDVERNGWNLCGARLEDILANRKGAIRALVASNLHGSLQDMQLLRELCDRFHVRLIEDACQSLGRKTPDGAPSRWADFTVVSFGGGKAVSCGRGGALLSTDEALAHKARLAAGAGSGPYGLSEVQCGIALAQLKWLPELTELCCSFFAQVIERMDELGISNPLASLDIPGKQAIKDRTASIYQFGCLMNVHSNPNPSPVNQAEAKSTSGLVGKGFSGFHRRSERRCRIPIPMENVPLVAERTQVVHHRIALQEQELERDRMEQVCGELRLLAQAANHSH